MVSGSPEVGLKCVKMGTSVTVHQVEALMGKGYAMRITQLPNSQGFQDCSLTINIAADGERNYCYFHQVD